MKGQDETEKRTRSRWSRKLRAKVVLEQVYPRIKACKRGM